MNIIEQLNWRYATKKFDTTKKVSETDLNTILEAVRLAPSSFGVQPTHVTVITNPELRTQLRAVSWDQQQITDASYVLVFSARIDFDACMDMYCSAAAESGYTPEQLEGWRGMVSGFLSQIDDQKKYGWAMRQTYIALGFGLTTCAHMNIDACPMEGFDKDEYARILELPEHIKPCALLTIGYRNADDVIHPKTRQTTDQLFDFRA